MKGPALELGRDFGATWLGQKDLGQCTSSRFLFLSHLRYYASSLLTK